MRNVERAIGVVLTLALAVVGSGCAGNVKITTAKMCAAHGGTYNAASKTCSYTQSTRSAQQICQAQDGYYDTAADICSYNP